jgi:hypothetical protein
MKIREQDNWGSGAFGASRGNRKHKGVDAIVWSGNEVRAFRSGKVNRIGFPYSQSIPEKAHYRLIEIQHGDDRHGYYYIDPCVSAGDEITAGQIIGTAQDIASAYPGITPHIHFQFRKPDGSYIDPTQIVEGGIAKDLPFRAKIVKGVILIYRRADGGFFSTMSSTIPQAKAFIENEIKNNGNEFAVKALQDIDWSTISE